MGGFRDAFVGSNGTLMCIYAGYYFVVICANCTQFDLAKKVFLIKTK